LLPLALDGNAESEVGLNNTLDELSSFPVGNSFELLSDEESVKEEDREKIEDEESDGEEEDEDEGVEEEVDDEEEDEEEVEFGSS
jgi:hypothetical protein